MGVVQSFCREIICSFYQYPRDKGEKIVCLGGFVYVCPSVCLSACLPVPVFICVSTQCWFIEPDLGGARDCFYASR